MNEVAEQDKPNAASEFTRLNDQRSPSLPEELFFFMRENKAWWMVPILVVFALFGLLMVLGSTGAAPFIYTLF